MSPVPASSNPWLDDAIGGIRSGDVYVDGAVDDAAQLQQKLTDAVPGDGSIAVVVLPAEAGTGAPYQGYLLEQLTAAAGQRTVILAVGDDLSADSVAIESEEALRIANENEASAPDTAAALVETVQEISGAIPDAPGGDASGGADAGPLLPLAIAGVVVVAAAGTAIGLLARRRRKTPTASADPVPAGIRLRLDRLRELRPAYAALPGNPVAAETATGIDTLVSHVEQLFARLDAKAGQDQSALAETEYSDKLARLVAALDHDYLLDLLTRPDLWDDPDARVGEVREALAGLTAQIVDNIKQVNARKGLHFQVSLDSLIGRSELRDWERQFNSGAGE